MILQLDRALDLTFDRVAACATIADWPARVGLDATRGAQMGGVRPPPPWLVRQRRTTVAAAGVAGGSSTVASISQA